jgi:Lon protease-like protein
MPDRIRRDFPLFPLGLVVLPTEYVPLHIFEDRYRTMIGECLERDTEFGVIWLADDELKPIGCACAIERVLERMDDGRMNILTRGTRPFRLIERQDGLPYPAGTIEFLDDRDAPPDEQAGRVAREAYTALVAEATDAEPDVERILEMTAYEMAGTVEFGLDAKQGLLELRSENARLRLITRRPGPGPGPVEREGAVRLRLVGRRRRVGDAAPVPGVAPPTRTQQRDPAQASKAGLPEIEAGPSTSTATLRGVMMRR